MYIKKVVKNIEFQPYDERELAWIEAVYNYTFRENYSAVLGEMGFTSTEVNQTISDLDRGLKPVKPVETTETYYLHVGLYNVLEWSTKLNPSTAVIMSEQTFYSLKDATLFEQS